MINYIPIIRDNPKLLTDKSSAWGDIPTILKDIILRFEIDTKKCIEFGVEYGYSTAALANYFDSVVGVDTFLGDIHAGIVSDHYQSTKERLSIYPNIKLVQSNYQNYIENSSECFDLAHIDIVHTYEDTFNCGDWCVQRSKVTIFHDTESFPDVKQACTDLAIKHNMTFYNYPESYGLGILTSLSMKNI